MSVILLHAQPRSNIFLIILPITCQILFQGNILFFFHEYSVTNMKELSVIHYSFDII